MDIHRHPAEATAWSDAAHRQGLRIGFVPTMGALHDGHLALVAEARRRAERVVVSIFVNPLQFNRRDDFDAYPRPIEADLERCRAAGVDTVYAPTAAAMYPSNFQTHVDPGPLAEPLEGAGRPGHFRGVVTVVTKLFHAVRPDVAVFGQKDFQQLAVIRRMVDDLDFGIEIIGLPTVREADGLARSSRNQRLTSADRVAAIVVPRALQAVASSIGSGATPAQAVAFGQAVIDGEPAARLEYLRLVDPLTLEDVTAASGPMQAVIAAWFGEVRLIDNIAIDPPR